MKLYNHEKALKGTPLCDSWGNKVFLKKKLFYFNLEFYFSNGDKVPGKFDRNGNCKSKSIFFNSKIFLDIGDKNLGWKADLPTRGKETISGYIMSKSIC